ncbi:MAG: hypothetical protein ABS76_20325 [Pelagibacterium sp. SCN 64-44]|nr:MAG: hypothetical protein ABS76_20325 [Pelagibacterium sp. SCN 64-44]
MTLSHIRSFATLLVSALALVAGLSAIVTDFVVQQELGTPAYIALAGIAALAAGYALLRHQPAFRYLAVTVLMSGIAATLASAEGTPWQTDLHMAFFAALAISALLYDVRAIILGTVLVAVHHLGIGMALPEMVFYGGGGLARILLHAVILVVEAAGLIWLMLNTFKLLTLARDHSDQAEAHAEQARGLAREVEEGEALRLEERSRTLAELREEFGSVVTAALDGDFSRRVPTSFAENDLNELARSVNTLVENIEGGLRETSSVMAALSAQDLTRRVEGQYRGAFAGLKQDTNKVADRLAEVVNAIRNASGTLTHATADLLTGAQDLSQRTAQQAGTVRKTSDSIETLARAVHSNAERAGQASAATARVAGTAETGSKVMIDATDAMARIGKSSEQISGIIGLIDDIAFQTNLLALNASVEAARAGEAGKGFAVVAVEVRRLAQSAAEASAEIKALIEQATSQVGEGTSLVGRAAETLTQIAEAARTSNELMQGIAEAAADQNHAIAEVDDAVRRIDAITQHNAALVEQANAAVAQAQGQATTLDGIVNVFRVDAGTAATSHAA